MHKLLTKLVVTDNKYYDFINLDTLPLFGDSLRIVHCYDLYQANNWHNFQERIYEKRIVQPFKQVFRELYTKLPEEMNQSSTNRYSGYQIEVKKVVATLKGRRWSVSYEEGLEKIDYHSNIVVNLYADADWFSPADIEAPAIDHVVMSDRKTGKPVLIKDIPPITYSEIMRDIDLAVSISAVGGVDPITNISTIELRKNIAQLTAKLLKLNNIEFKDYFMIIKGSRATYMMHLQTGIVRQVGSSNIFIVPVHSQKRGKLYLPFIDEDPKCQEIISKMVLLSEDHKIKDPAILDQIH